jgi:hypothetical protein
VPKPKKYLRLDEIVTEALKHIPPTVPEFKKILSFTPVTNIGKIKRKPSFGITKAKIWQTQ